MPRKTTTTGKCPLCTHISRLIKIYATGTSDHFAYSCKNCKHIAPKELFTHITTYRETIHAS